MKAVDNIQGKLRLAVGTVKDQASIGKAIIHKYKHQETCFSDIEIAVVRATGHDNTPMDDKQMHQILFLVSNSPASVPFLAERISRRLGKTRDPLVALKTLLLIHRLLRGGNRHFEHQLRRMRLSGHLQMRTSHFVSDYSSVSCFLHRYAAFLEERIGWVINQSGKLEPVDSNANLIRSYDETLKSIDVIFRKLPKCQAFIDKVLDCWPISDDNILCRSQAAIMSNTLKESFQVYTTYCESVSSLVNMFFELTMPARASACQILKRASQQSLELYRLYENCKQVIDNRNLDYPFVQIITMDHVMALEQCSVVVVEPAVSNKLTAVNEGERKFALETKVSTVWVHFEDDIINIS